jgi:hypothetical protein
MRRLLCCRSEHDPEKACPGLDPGWEPVFGQDHARRIVMIAPYANDGKGLQGVRLRPCAITDLLMKS